MDTTLSGIEWVGRGDLLLANAVEEAAAEAAAAGYLVLATPNREP